MTSSTKRWWVAGALLVAGAAALAAVQWRSSRRVPAGQPPFLALERGNLEQLRGAFNAQLDRPRLIAFLSPT